MREKPRDKERLEHILEAIEDIDRGKDKYSQEQITTDPIAYFGFVKEVEIIGEAVYMLTNEYKEAHPEVMWSVIEKMRHVLVHGYYTINKQQLWDTIQNDIPALKPQIEKLIKEM